MDAAVQPTLGISDRYRLNRVPESGLCPNAKWMDRVPQEPLTLPPTAAAQSAAATP